MDDSREDRSEILAGDSTIFWQRGSAETWLISGSSWEEQRVQGLAEIKAGLSKGSEKALSSISDSSVRRLTAEVPGSSPGPDRVNDQNITFFKW